MAGASLTVALIANFSIGVMKLIVGIFTGSAAMISEAYHSFADTFNQILLALGIRRSKKKPDLEHPFGYSKVQFFWAFIVAVLIFGISGTLALLEGIEIILHPEEHGKHIRRDLFIWNILVLIVAIILESTAFRAAFREANHFKEETGSESIIEALDEKQDPVLLSLLVEDSLALIGLVIALVGVSTTYIIDEPIIDGYTSLLIGIILMTGGLLLARENKTYLIGKAVTHRTQFKIREVLEAHEGIKKILSMRTMLLGPNDMILTIDLEFTEEIEKGDLAADIDKLEQELIEVIPMLTPGKIFIEAQ
ncbi:MAG: cation diffusion facilitator family transporter [Candidatus Kariarchaeaceae archaeon]|jgi:cation diffusion facilitator family transporter